MCVVCDVLLLFLRVVLLFFELDSKHCVFGPLYKSNGEIQPTVLISTVVCVLSFVRVRCHVMLGSIGVECSASNDFIFS